MHGFDAIKRENVAFSEYLVVVEFFGRGYIMAVKDSAEEAESWARGITYHINSSTNEDSDIKEIIKPYRVLIEYNIRGNSTFITNSLWCDLQGIYEIYVVGINYKDGGLQRFIRERENYSLLLSIDDLISKYEKIRSNFKGFTFCAN
ncbi:MAG TPA: hypothetical protein PK563_14140 [Tenuifilaceae bacterium]|nr:hypothetical protein [Tenuifilaceae bacterium]